MILGGVCALAEPIRNWTGAPRSPQRTPDFLYAAPDTTACAAFSKESRMKFANATKLHRKSGGSPTIAFC